MYTYAIYFATATRHGLSDQQRVNAKTYIAWRWLPLRDPTRTTPHRVTPAPPRPAARTTASLVSASTARSGSRVRADVMTALKGSVARRARQRLRAARTKCGHRSCQQADDWLDAAACGEGVTEARDSVLHRERRCENAQRERCQVAALRILCQIFRQPEQGSSTAGRRNLGGTSRIDVQVPDHGVLPAPALRPMAIVAPRQSAESHQPRQWNLRRRH